MVSESPAGDPTTADAKQDTTVPLTPPSSQPAELNGGDTVPAQTPQVPQAQQSCINGAPPQDGGTTEPGAAIPVPFQGVSMCPYPLGGPITRPKRTQCKNACTNCQKACKRCDDTRPCQRCIRYGITDTCVDSKRKERKKGVKRGPYKKRDSKGQNMDADLHGGGGARFASGTHAPLPNMPYIGPVGYPPGMWSSYAPGPGTNVEGTGFYQPIFTLTPVVGQAPPHGDVENAGGPHFPIGFYPATFISYPGPYSPYPFRFPGQNGLPHGFHYNYPPPPHLFLPRPPNLVATTNGNSGVGVGMPGHMNPQNRDNPNPDAFDDGGKGKLKEDITTNLQGDEEGKTTEAGNATIVKNNP